MAYFSITLADDFGRTTKRRIEVEDQALLADYMTVAGAFSTALEAVTDLALTRMDLTIEAVDAGFDVVSDANVDRGATFSGYIDGGNGKKASHKVPGIKLSLVDADGSVDLTGAVATYLAQFLTAGDLAISDGETISSWIKGTLDK